MTFLRDKAMEIVPHLFNVKSDAVRDPFGFSGNRGTFLSAINRALGSTQGKSRFGVDRPRLHSSGASENARQYLETLRGRLRAAGKPLDTLYLGTEDLDAVKTFLFQCGYDRHQVVQCAKNILKKSSDGQIRASDLLAQLDALTSPGKAKTRSVLLDPSVIPHMESVLRDFGLTPKKIEGIVSGAKAEQGGIDLNRFVKQLRAVARAQIPSVQEAPAGDRLSPLFEKIDALGVSVSRTGLRGEITLKDFAAGLEGMAARLSGDETQMKTSSLRQAGAIALNNTAASPLSQEILVTSIPADGKAAFRQNPVNATLQQDFGPVAGPAFLENGSLKLGGPQDIPAGVADGIAQILKKVRVKDARPQAPASPLPETKLSKVKPVVAESVSPQKVSSVNDLSEKAAPVKETLPMADAAMPKTSVDPSATAAGRGAEAAVELESGVHLGSAIHKEVLPGPTEISPSGAGSHRVEDAVAAGQKPSTPTLLPNYLVAQVGRQISKSLLKGDGTIRFRVQPPSLSAVRIELDMKGSRLKLEVTAENSAVKELLLARVPELKTVLKEFGVKLERLDVQINNAFDPSTENSNTRSGAAFGGSDARGQGPQSLPDEERKMAVTADSGRFVATAGVIDLMA